MKHFFSLMCISFFCVGCNPVKEDSQLPTVSSCMGQEAQQCTSTRTSPVPPILSPWYEGEVSHSIDFESIFGGGPPKDGIPAIDTPLMVDSSRVDFLTDDSRGVLIEIDGDIRFYPYSILNWHEVVNDTVGNTPVSVTYCPLCATAVVYQRGETSFGVSGLLYNSNLLLYDRETETLWNQLSGTAVVGPKTGQTLVPVPSTVTAYGRIKNTEGLQILSTATGFARAYDKSPYAGYDAEPEISFPVENEDSRLPTKDLVYGLVVDGAPKAYPASLFTKTVHIDDTFGETNVAIFVNSAGSIAATVNGTPAHILPSYWFAWVAQYPKTTVYQTPR